MATLSRLRAPRRRGDARRLSPHAPATARGVATVLGFRTHQSSGRHARHALRAPRGGARRRRCCRQWAPAERATDGGVTRVTQAKRIAAWLYNQLPDAAMRAVLTVAAAADDDVDDDDDDSDE